MTAISARASSSEAPGASRPITVRGRLVRSAAAVGIERERRPHLRAHGEVEPLRRDADDFVRLGVQRDRCPTIAGSPPKRRCHSPWPMTARRWRPGVPFGQESAADRRLHAERREEIRGDAEALHPFRLVAANQVDVHQECRQALNPVALPLPVEEIRRGHLLAAVLGIAGAVGQRAGCGPHRGTGTAGGQRVDHRQDGGVRAQPERERQHDEAGEPRPLQVGSQRIFHVEAEGAHQGVSSRRRNRKRRAGRVHARPAARSDGMRAAIARGQGTRGEAPVSIPDGGGQPAGGGAPSCSSWRSPRMVSAQPPPRESRRAGARPLSAGAGRRHDSSSPSSPPQLQQVAARRPQRREPRRRDLKYRRDRPPRSGSGSPIRDLR